MSPRSSPLDIQGKDMAKVEADAVIKTMAKRDLARRDNIIWLLPER